MSSKIILTLNVQQEEMSSIEEIWPDTGLVLLGGVMCSSNLHVKY